MLFLLFNLLNFPLFNFFFFINSTNSLVEAYTSLNKKELRLTQIGYCSPEWAAERQHGRSDWRSPGCGAVLGQREAVSLWAQLSSAPEAAPQVKKAATESSYEVLEATFGRWQQERHKSAAVTDYNTVRSPQTVRVF